MTLKAGAGINELAWTQCLEKCLVVSREIRMLIMMASASVGGWVSLAGCCAFDANPPGFGLFRVEWTLWWFFHIPKSSFFRYHYGLSWFTWSQQEGDKQCILCFLPEPIGAYLGSSSCHCNFYLPIFLSQPPQDAAYIEIPLGFSLWRRGLSDFF